MTDESLRDLVDGCVKLLQCMHTELIQRYRDLQDTIAMIDWLEEDDDSAYTESRRQLEESKATVEKALLALSLVREIRNKVEDNKNGTPI